MDESRRRRLPDPQWHPTTREVEKRFPRFKTTGAEFGKFFCVCAAWISGLCKWPA
jgi:hypothetical protein